ncbi:MAG: nucleotidyltransferase domain-containing protein [Methanobacteriaceae archaeon]|nr:nucleotidyltransferase domain-containing protein [Methanobacteriaceae archaeon]
MKTYQLSQLEKVSLKKKLSEKIRTHPEILFCYIHGSIMDSSWFRDVDLAVYLKEDSIEDVYTYETKVSLELESLVGLPVDVKVLNVAPLSFQYQVSKGEVLFTRDEDTRTSFLERTWLLYLDLKPVREEYYRELLKE